jgi:hypothetical protein
MVYRSGLWSLVLAVGMASCSGGALTRSLPADGLSAQPAARTSAVTGARVYQYVVGEDNLPALEADSNASSLLAEAAQAGVAPIVILHAIAPPYEASAPAPASWNAHYCLRWMSEEQMAQNVASGSIPSYVDCFMYDNETNAYPGTPTVELQNPPAYYIKAAQLAQGHVPIFYPTAGVTYVAGSVYSSATAEATALWQTASYWTLAGQAFYGIQSQTVENDLTRFVKVINNRANAIHAVNPAVNLTVGVGDYAGGVCQPESVMAGAAQAAPAGYPVWSNVSANAACVTANFPYTSQMADSLGM